VGGGSSVGTGEDRRYTCFLAECPIDIASVGGKAASLAKLAGAGMPVPPAFVITTDAYRRFVAENGIQPSEAVDTQQISEEPDRIRRLFETGALPSEIEHAIVQAYDRLTGGSGAVAVRSSATAEDLPGASFAGQQETYLNVRGPEAVLRAVRRCWASLWAPRAVAYRSRLGVAPESIALAVVVQALVPADAAGILFTADPVTGQDDVISICASWGLGNAVVGGW